jgi:hypothetical protein
LDRPYGLGGIRTLTRSSICLLFDGWCLTLYIDVCLYNVLAEQIFVTETPTYLPPDPRERTCDRFISHRVCSTPISCPHVLMAFSVQCNGYTDGDWFTSPAALAGPVAAGATVTLNWTLWPTSHEGPIITYMARVPDGQSVTSWMPGSA